MGVHRARSIALRETKGAPGRTNVIVVISSSLDTSLGDIR
jgi:hypothetical protein